MKQPFTSSGARSVVKQEDVEHDMQSDSNYRHSPDSSATEFPGAYLLEWVEVLLQLNRGDERCLVDGLLSIFQTADFDILLFLKCAKVSSMAFRTYTDKAMELW